jgi:hypothetical protein
MMNDYSILRGVLADRPFRITLDWGRCANPRCDRLFEPRADGDLYCCESCDWDDNPHLRGER